jgi:hypothetical protein
VPLPLNLLVAGGDGDAGVDWFTVGILGVMATVVGRLVMKSIKRKSEYRECKRMLAKLKRVCSVPQEASVSCLQRRHAQCAVLLHVAHLWCSNTDCP